MKEVKVLFGHSGETLRWHDDGATAGSIPDSRELWEYMWEHRPLEKGGTGLFAGFAHTHPWRGKASPSGTDLTTFRALDQALGGLFWWPVVTFTDIIWLRWSLVHDQYLVHPEQPLELKALAELRKRSKQ